ncbi:cytoplasmic tRNA 2-thiolation protein 2 isoform X2 [Apis cerana]|nr:cytoplasmic tRNA 2-thiolation protein 2 isoform X2 [Apis cerana]
MCTKNTSKYTFDTFEVENITENIITSSFTDTVNIHNTMPFCKKCGCQEVQVFLKNKNQYCKMCFLTILIHKFRATLGKSKSVRANDTVLIAHSGKANSTVLLHLITADINKSISKKLKFPFKVLYIDDGIIKKRSIEERESIRNALAKEAENLQLTMYISSLSNCTIDTTTDKELQSINVPLMNTTKEDTTLQEVFNNLENDTARDELLQQLRRKLLVSAARKLNCNKVFIADTSIDLAIKVLGDVSTGRGSQLSFNVAFSDERYSDVKLLRPLKDFTKDDIIAYTECCELHPILNSQKYDFCFPASIRNIARNFVYKLDSEFYGAVSTIYRTSEKLATNVEPFNNINNDTKIITNKINVNNICILCELNFRDSDYLSKEELSVVQAKLFSKLVSTVTNISLDTTMNSLNTCAQSSNEQSECVNAFTSKKCQCKTDICNSFLRQSMIEKYLCYSCSLIFSNVKEMNNILPNFIFDAIQKELQIANLKKEITDFLL